jgi:hypothetical protein
MLVATVMTVVAAMGVFVVGALAVVANSPSGFESSDGNMTLDVKDGLHTDWNCFAGAGNTGGFSSAVTPDPNCAVKSGALNSPADPAGEVVLVKGSKFDDQCPGLTPKSAPPKDEFTDVASFTDSTATTPSDTFFYGASIRPVTNGNASGNVELNQVSGDGITAHGCRTAGDRLIAYDFLNGGTALSFHVLTYITPGNTTAGGNSGKCFTSNNMTPPCWGANVIVPDSSVFEGQANQAAIAALDNSMTNTALTVNAFAEFGINLSKALGLEGQCISFPQEVWESRSSGASFGSNPEDMEFQNLKINNCGTITIVKNTDPRGLNQNFSFSASTGLMPSSFTLNDSGTNSQTYSNVPAGGYTITEGTEPTGFAPESLTCTGGTGTASADKLSVSITLNPQDNIVCTFVNQALGEIIIKKDTAPRGIDQAFSFTSTSPSTPGLPASFSLNDKGNSSSGDSSGNTSDTTSLPVGTYTVNEGTEPAGWTPGTLVCTTGGTTTTNTKATIVLTAGAVVTCTFVNNQPTGAIQVTKTGKYKGCATKTGPTQITVNGTVIGTCVGDGTTTMHLSGAKFSVTGTDLLGGAVSSTLTTGADGTACVAGLPWNGTGNAFSVTETAAPSGYSLDNGNAQSVNVTQNADCGTNVGTAATRGFTDTPLTKLSVTAAADQPGATQSTITCSTDGTGFTNPFAKAALNDPATASKDGLNPGTYYCKVVVDP